MAKFAEESSKFIERFHRKKDKHSHLPEGLNLAGRDIPENRDKDIVRNFIMFGIYYFLRFCGAGNGSFVEQVHILH